jgi:biopolymer transport protein ExbB
LKPLQSVVGVAPLLGLMGTVYGMIVAFQGLGGEGDKVDVLSKGIYEALVTTAAGLTIAIPFLFVYQWLSRKTDEIGENINRQAAVLLEKFYPSVGGEAKRETEAPADPGTAEAAPDSEPRLT